MLQNFFKTTWRGLAKGGIYSFLNLAGLTVGTATVVLLILFVKDEWTFDRFHSDHKHIYRAWVKEHFQDKVFFNTVTPYILGQELKDNFPEISQVTRYVTSDFLIKKGNFSEKQTVHLVEPSFFEVFDFPILEGDAGQAFVELHRIVLTPDMAEKYFGVQNPVGKTLSMQLNGVWTDFMVSGIIQKAPGNSSIQFDMLIPFEITRNTFSDGVRTNWMQVTVETYVQLNEAQSVADLEAKIAPFIDQKVAADYEPGKYIVGFQPLTDIHLNGTFPTGIVAVSDARYPKILAWVALLILLLAAINFTTLAIGRAVTRAKEVGVRKVTGARKGQLMLQFWSEAVLTAIMAVVAGTILVKLSLPFFNNLTDKQLAFDFNAENVLLCAGLSVITGLLAGTYPSLVLSGFTPIRALRGTVSKIGSDKHLVLRSLVGLQFLLSILLLACTFVMGNQLKFLQTRNLGFDKEQVLVLPYSNSGMRISEMWQEGKRMALRLANELSNTTAFKDFALSNHVFGWPGWMRLGYTDQKNDTYRHFYLNGISDRFFPMLNLQLVEGRYPIVEQNAADAKAVVVNQAYAAEFEVQVGQPLPEPFQANTVVGIAKDFNFQSLHTIVQPLVLSCDPFDLMRAAPDMSILDSPNPKILLKIDGQNLPATIAQLRLAWGKVAPDQAFDYAFMDENINRQYKAEQRFSQVIGYATALAIFIACLGLFGISTLSIARRTKEIGVRKILGASAIDILVSINKGFAMLVVFASLMAAPIAWYLMSLWLDDFAYRIDLHWWMFALVGVIAIGIAIVSVAYQSLKATMANPVESLRSE